jgi:amino acid adenylation domain-containing protein
MDENQAIWAGFLDSVNRFPDRPALWVDGETLSYGQLDAKAKRIAATIQRYGPNSDPALTAVFAYRSPTAFAGVLGALLAGHGYVPLNRTFPIERTKIMLDRSQCQALVVDSSSALQVDQVIDEMRRPLVLILADIKDVSEYRERWQGHIVLGEDDLENGEAWRKPSVSHDSIAYLLFTSGSTGIPKGVMVAHRNVTPFVDYMTIRYGISESDRLSQMFDMTFDLSVFDMFVAWEKGACLCCPSQKTSIKPGKFIQDRELTLWFSVPSTAVFMKRFGMLKPNRYPSLRWSLFCGEPLPVESTRAWAEAAPNSVVENLYGPTELTIACTLYRWDNKKSLSECEHGIVPIGYPYPGMQVLVVDQNLKEVKAGAEGELLMTGPQMTPGYWRDPEKTAAAFITPPGKYEIFYRTGDRVRRPVGDGPLTHLGRVDFQVKIHGHRVELGEVEAVVREESGLDGVVAVGWPVTASGASGIVVFLEGTQIDRHSLHNKVAKRLPDYMTPKEYIFMDRMPLNVNGKFDRAALLRKLKQSI